MAKIEKLKKIISGILTTIYPVTIPQAVINPATNKIHGYDEEEAIADALVEVEARIKALEAIVSNVIKDRVEVTREFNVWGKTNLILSGSGASTKAPDFIGQTYIDTTGGNIYIAKGTVNAGDWKLV